MKDEITLEDLDAWGRSKVADNRYPQSVYSTLVDIAACRLDEHSVEDALDMVIDKEWSMSIQHEIANPHDTRRYYEANETAIWDVISDYLENNSRSLDELICEYDQPMDNLQDFREGLTWIALGIVAADAIRDLNGL